MRISTSPSGLVRLPRILSVTDRICWMPTLFVPSPRASAEAFCQASLTSFFCSATLVNRASGVRGVPNMKFSSRVAEALHLGSLSLSSA